MKRDINGKLRDSLYDLEHVFSAIEWLLDFGEVRDIYMINIRVGIYSITGLMRVKQYDE